MRKYEIMVIVDPEISEEEREETFQFLKNSLSEWEGKILSEELWGKRKLAYKIRSRKEWYYALYHAELDEKKVFALKHKMNLNNHILRYMVIRDGE